MRATAPALAADALHELIDRAGKKDSAAQAAMLSLVHLRRYEEELGYDCLATIYAHADDRGYADVKQLLHTGVAKRTLPRDGSPENEFLERTLGERKGLAMSTNRDIMDRLMRDRHPEVIRILLQNPRLIERDVVRIAAMRPAEARVLETIVESHKWIARYAVKKAIVCNPYTPTNISSSLIGFLLVSDMRTVADMATLADGLRDAARKRVKALYRHSETTVILPNKRIQS